MKLRIVSDGTPRGGRVEHAETGELLDHVARVDLEGTPDGFRAVIYVHQVAVDVVARGVRRSHRRPPITGRPRI